MGFLQIFNFSSILACYTVIDNKIYTQLNIKNKNSKNFKNPFKKTLIEKKIIDETNSKEILEQKLLPIWSRKQKEIEEYIQKIDVN